jgi:uncharacterized protein
VALMATSTQERVVELDVVRAVALIGVVTMNYHGYLLIRSTSWAAGDDFIHRVFNPWTGPLSTRFAATFVLVAGMGITLLTNRSRRSGDRVAIRADRWKLARRGLLLFSFGAVFDYVWAGTILYFYGAYLLIASVVFAWRARYIALLGLGSAIVSTGVLWWEYVQTEAGRDVGWLRFPSERSPRGLLFDTVLNGTHPVFPWLAFVCAGMLLGRAVPFATRLRWKLIAGGCAMVAVAYLAEHLFAGRSTLSTWLVSNDSSSGSLTYAVCALGSSLAAVGVIGWIAAANSERKPIRWLAITGRSTLTLYVAHALLFNLVVDILGWVEPAGLHVALLCAAAFWLIAVVAAVNWHARFGMAPLERVYRAFGG